VGRMAELDLEIRERLALGQTPEQMAKLLDVPTHWVTEIVSENAYTDYMAERAAQEFAAEQFADADALNYGTR